MSDGSVHRPEKIVIDTSTLLALGIDGAAPLRSSIVKDFWTEIPFDKDDPRYKERLVAVGIRPDKEKYRAIYYIPAYNGGKTSPYDPNEMPSALTSCFMREEAAERLTQVAEKIKPLGCVVFVWDAYRPLPVQDYLFRQYADALTRNNYDRESAETMASLYVRPAGDNAPHTCGSAIDLTFAWLSPETWKRLDTIDAEIDAIKNDEARLSETLALEWCREEIVRTEGVLLDTGHSYDRVFFDEDGDRTNALYYENKLEKRGVLSFDDTVRLNNRRFIGNVMMAFGFSIYPDEQGQFNLFDKPWAQATGNAASSYGPVELSEKNRRHEDLLRAFDRMLKEHEQSDPRAMRALLCLNNLEKINLAALNRFEGPVHPSNNEATREINRNDYN